MHSLDSESNSLRPPTHSTSLHLTHSPTHSLTHSLIHSLFLQSAGLTEKDVCKDVWRTNPYFREFAQKHIRLRRYKFQYRKCDDPSCRFHKPVRSPSVVWNIGKEFVPDAMLSEVRCSLPSVHSQTVVFICLHMSSCYLCICIALPAYLHPTTRMAPGICVGTRHGGETPLRRTTLLI